MDIILIDQLTKEYKQAIESDWSILRVDDIEVDLRDVYVILKAIDKAKPNSDSPPLDLSQVLNHARLLVLLGEPGAGKSTTLQFIGLCFAHNDWHKAKLNMQDRCIPVKIDLRSYATLLAEPGPRIEQAVALAVREYLRQADENKVRNLVAHWMNNSNLLILLDGLDEVQDTLRGLVKEEIYRFSSSLGATNTRVIVTSRLAGYSTPSSLFKEFTIKPFEGAEDAKPYLQSWLMALGPNWDKEKADEEAARLLEKMMNHSALRRVIDNPLILRIAAKVYVGTGEIASNRSKLYQQYIKDLWERAVRRGADNNLQSQVMTNIEALAWQLHTNASPDIPIAITAIIQEKMGLATQVGNRLSFSHMTLQEHFVGQHLARAWRTNRTGAWQFLRARLHVAEWQEPILLMAGGLSQDESDELTRKIYNTRSRFEQRYHRDKILIAAIAGEGGFVSQNIVKKIYSKVLHVNSRLGRLILGQGKSEIDTLIKASKGLGETSSPVLLQLLKNPDDAIQSAAINALEEMNAEAAISELLTLYHSTDNYMIAASCLIALAELKESKVIPEIINLIKSGNYYWGSIAANAFAKIRALETIPILLELPSEVDDYFADAVVIAVVETLSQTGLAAVPYLYEALEHKHAKVRNIAISTLENLNIKEAAPLIRRALMDEDPDNKVASIYAIASLNTAEAIPDLIAILYNETDEWIRDAVVRALGYFKSNKVISELTLLAHGTNIHLQETAIKSLRQIGAKHALENITPRDIALSIVQSVQGKFPRSDYLEIDYPDMVDLLNDRRQDSINYLRAQLKGSDSDEVRWAVAELLGKMHAKEAVVDLIPALEDRNSYVRQSAVKTLETLNARDAIPFLLKMLVEPNKDVANRVIMALGNLNAFEAIPHLKRLLHNKQFQGTSAIALGKMRVWEVLPYFRRRKKVSQADSSYEYISVLGELISDLPTGIATSQVRFYKAELESFLSYGPPIERLALEKLEMILAADSPYQSPFDLIKATFLEKSFTIALYVATIIAVTALITLLTLLYSSAATIMEVAIGQSLEAQILTHRTATLIAIILVAVVIAFLLWFGDWLKDEIRKFLN